MKLAVTPMDLINAFRSEDDGVYICMPAAAGVMQDKRFRRSRESKIISSAPTPAGKISLVSIGETSPTFDEYMLFDSLKPIAARMSGRESDEEGRTVDDGSCRKLISSMPGSGKLYMSCDEDGDDCVVLDLGDDHAVYSVHTLQPWQTRIVLDILEYIRQQYTINEELKSLLGNGSQS